MSYNTYMMIFYISAIVAVIMFLLSLFLFFKLKIVKTIGFLTGTSAKKEIKNIRAKTKNNIFEQRQITEALPTNTNQTETTVLNTSQNSNVNETTVLNANQNNSSETTVLNAGQGASNETTVLNANQSNFSETTLLQSGKTSELPDMSTSNNKIVDKNKKIKNIIFEIEDEITFIHTSEIIA